MKEHKRTLNRDNNKKVIGTLFCIAFIILMSYAVIRGSDSINKDIAKKQSIIQKDIMDGKILDLYYTDSSIFGRQHYVVTESGEKSIGAVTYYKLLKRIDKGDK